MMSGGAPTVNMAGQVGGSGSSYGQAFGLAGANQPQFGGGAGAQMTQQEANYRKQVHRMGGDKSWGNVLGGLISMLTTLHSLS